MALGKNALIMNTTGSNNIAIGTLSNQNSITASDNVVISISALSTNSTGTT